MRESPEMRLSSTVRGVWVWHGGRGTPRGRTGMEGAGSQLTEALLSPNALRWHRGHSSASGTEERRPLPLTGHFLRGGTFGEGDLTETDSPCRASRIPQSPRSTGSRRTGQTKPGSLRGFSG